MKDRDARLSQCLQSIEETGEIERCVALHPDLDPELRDYGRTLNMLASAAPPESQADSQSASRQRALTALAQPAVSTASGGNWVRRAAGGFAVIAILLAGAAGATAATPGGLREMGPVSEVLAAVGIIERQNSGESLPPQAGPPGVEEGSKPGRGISDDVDEAIEATEPGPERGIAVSEAACEAAHDPDRLPEKAAEAKAGQNKEPKDCTHPNADGTAGNGNGTHPNADGTPGNGNGTHPNADGTPDNGNGNGSKPEKEPKEPGKPEATPGANKQGGGPPGGEPPGKNKKP